jgi:hypothetical protein
MRRILLTILALALLALPSTASAEEEGEEGPKRATTKHSLLIWGPSAIDDGGDLARTALEERLKPEIPFPSRILRISDWLGAARFRLGGSAVSIPCATPPSEEALPDGIDNEIEGLLLLGKTALEELDPVAALAHLQLAEARIPCQSVFVSRDLLYQTYFYTAMAAYFAGKAKTSASYFRLAAAIDSDRDWDSSFGPEPQATFLSAVQDVVSRPEGRVFGDMRATNYVEVRLDGESLDLTKAFEARVMPGIHLVQAVDDQGRWDTFMRKVDEAATLTFFSATGAEQMVLEGPDGVLKTIAAGTLTQRASEEQITEIYLVTVNEEGLPRVYSFTPEIKQWARLVKLETGEIQTTTEVAEVADVASKEPELTKAEETRAAFLRDADYRSSATFGFKLHQWFMCGPNEVTLVGADERCGDGRQREQTYIGGLVGIDVRLVRGLNLDFRFGAHVTNLQSGGTLLPEISIGVKYRFLTGVFQPYLGAGGDIFIGTTRASRHSKSEVTVYGGIVGFGGVDFEFPDGFRLTLEGGGGVILAGEGVSPEWPTAHMMVSIGRFLE